MKNTKLKSILLITATLLIGFVLGFLVSGRLTHQRIRKMVENRGGRGFQSVLVAAIEPTAEQKPLIQPILESFGERMDSMHHRHADELQENFSLLVLSLEPYLQPAQMENLKKRLSRMEGRARHLRNGNRHRNGNPDHLPSHKWPSREKE